MNTVPTVYGVPVTPLYGLAAKTRDELSLKVLDVARISSKLIYDEVRLAFEADTVDEDMLEEAATQRAESCCGYICKYICVAVQHDVGELHQSESTKLIAHLSTNVALERLALGHNDPLVKYMAQYGDWSLSFIGSTIQLVLNGVPESAPPPPQL